jgi:hypothetical protein
MFWVVDKTFAEKCVEWEADEAAKLKKKVAALERKIREMEEANADRSGVKGSGDEVKDSRAAPKTTP